MLSIKNKLIIVIVVIAIVIIFVYLYTKKKTTVDNSNTLDVVNSSLQQSGVFLRGTYDTLFYRDSNQVYYNAGTCSDCPSGCENSIEIQPIYKFYSCDNIPPDKVGLCPTPDPNKFVSIEIMSAEDYTKSILDKCGNNKIDVNQCVSILNSEGENTNLANQIAISAAQKSVDSGHQSIWDYLSSRKTELESLGGQIIEFSLLQKVIGDYAMIVMMLPLLNTSQGRYILCVQSGMFIANKFWTKGINGILKNALSSIDTEAETRLATLADNSLYEYSIRLTTEICERTLSRAAAEALVAAISIVNAVLDPLFDAIDFLMIVGMILDAIDPCSLENSLSDSDLVNISNSYNNAFYIQTLQSFNTYPIEWYAEFVPDYGLNCQITKDGLNKVVGACDADNILKEQFQDEYYKNLTVNSSGQTIINVDNQYLYNKMTEAGFKVSDPSTWTTPNNGLGVSNFTKVIDYVADSMADDNVLVSKFIRKYWYLFLMLCVIIVLILYLL